MLPTLVVWIAVIESAPAALPETESLNVSVPSPPSTTSAEAKVMKSVSSSTRNLSLPAPPERISAPPSPSITSLPSPPLIVSIDEGDTVIWKSVEKSHNVEFMTGGVPEGVGEFKSEISQDAEYTFSIPGIYAYICSPHKTGKMLGFVIVGNDKSNLDDIKALKYRGMSKKFAKQLIEDIENNY